MDNRPIGVFDSGLGGLTAVRELQKLLPQEDIVYFGDTGRVPYGTRSPETICRYAGQDIRFLLQHDVKMIVIACGTVSTTLPAETIASLPVPAIGVVEHTVRAACEATQNGRIGVIATPATTRTDAFGSGIRAALPQAEVFPVACSLFVPLVEAGQVERGNPITTPAAEMYLAPLREAGIDTLILGCTHYPLIREIIDEVLQHRVRLIDSGRETARYVERFLRENNMLAERAEGGRYRYFVSDSVEGFSGVASLFLQGDAAGEVQQVSVDLL